MMTSEGQRILYHTMLHSLEGNNIGLLTGKMGIALSLAAYAKTNNCTPVEDLAETILTKVLANLSKQTPIGFANGLAGIGWGIEYLAQNGFMQINTAEVCREIDERIMQSRVTELKDLSLETGLYGILVYINAHIYGNNQIIPFDTDFLNNLSHVLEKYKHVMPEAFFEQYTLFGHLLHHVPCHLDLRLTDYVLQDRINLDNEYDLSLRTGFAGYLAMTL